MLNIRIYIYIIFVDHWLANDRTLHLHALSHALTSQHSSVCILVKRQRQTVSQQETRIDLFCEGDFLKAASCGFGWERTSEKVLASAISELQMGFTATFQKRMGKYGKFLSFDFDPLEMNQREQQWQLHRSEVQVHGKQFLMDQLLSTPCWIKIILNYVAWWF